MLPQVSSRDRSGWLKCCRGNAARAISLVPAVTAPLLAGAFVLASLPTQPHVVQFAPCDTACQQQRWNAEVAQAERVIAARVADATAGRDCWTGRRNRIPSSVVVHDDGGTRVRVLSFAEGLRLARAGKVWVDAVCA